MIVAAIDIGSNTVRLLISDVVDGVIRQTIYEERFITRLAENISSTGKLSETAIERTMSALFSFDTAIQKYPVESVKAVATSAVREATNRDQFLGAAKPLSYAIEVISGTLESQLTFAGVSAGIDLKGASSLLVDIGGGSTEFVYHDGVSIVSGESVKLGVVKLAEMFNFKDNVSGDTLLQMQTVLEDQLYKSIDSGKAAKYLLATAGTPTTIAAISLEMTDYCAEQVNGLRLSKGQITAIFERLCSLTAAERCEVVGLETGREDLIIPGTYILLATMEKLNMKELIVCDNGLREGVALAAAD